MIRTLDPVPLRSIATHFQRSVNLVYDLGDADYVAGYIPTTSGAQVLNAILEGTHPQARQRAHVLHAAYGSGKSLLGLVMSALVRDNPRARSALALVEERLAHRFPQTQQAIQQYRERGTRLLPVVLSGDEGSLSTALLRALKVTLDQHRLAELDLQTPFQAAVDIIERWQRDYSSLVQQLEDTLQAQDINLPALVAALQALQPEALALFEQVYPALTGGAHFDRYAGPSLKEVFHNAAAAVRTAGYDGLFIIWDEFGRFLEARTADAFGPEAAQLQDLAEFCNRSGSAQVHLVLVTHRLFSVYAADLPLSYQQEWARIAERFRSYDLSSDPDVTYRLIGDALHSEDPLSWQQFLHEHQRTFQELTAHTLDFALFDEVDDARLRQQVVEQSWPLHPLTVYALPRLSAQVAQNERTLFTFLAADEPGTLATHLMFQNGNRAWWLARLDLLWDYFAEAIRRDENEGHTIWVGVKYALSKVPPEDDLARALIKSLGVLLLVGETNLQTQAHLGSALPTTRLLAWAVDVSEEEVAKRLDQLSSRKALTLRQAEGYWTFMRGSDVDLEAAIKEALDSHAPTRLQLRQLLERYVEAPFYLPRRYNQEHAMTRFFWSLYRWPREIEGVTKPAFLKGLGATGYADGAVVYVLATNEVERTQAIEAIRTLPASRVLFVVPHHPLLIEEPLREIFALRDLQNDPAFVKQDERLPGELEFFVEDARRRLQRALRPLKDPSLRGAIWWWHKGEQWRQQELTSAAQVSQRLSELTQQWFDQTPILNNESANQHEPTGQQLRAMERVIDGLLYLPLDTLPEDLELSGYGADWLILRTLLIRTGLLHPLETNAPAGDERRFYRLARPVEAPLSQIWDEVDTFLDQATEAEQEAEGLVDTLLSPPYGLRRGVLPLLLATIMRPRLPVLTIQRNRRVLLPLTGELFTHLVAKPQQYTIEVGAWDERRQALWEVLESSFEEYLTEQERAQQPLSYLSVGMLRWLQFQPRYCRDTNKLSKDAVRFRTLIRQAQRDPARVLLHELLEHLEEGAAVRLSAEEYSAALAERLSTLKNEIATAYQALLYTLDQFCVSLFTDDTTTPVADGKSALSTWLTRLERHTDTALAAFRFGDVLVQRLVEVGAEADILQGTDFWNALSYAVLGVSLHDWNDRSVASFMEKMNEARERAEREIVELSDAEEVVELHVHLPQRGERHYRFRPSALSPHGERILKNFKSTLDIAGRPLSPDEKRQVVLALLHDVLESS